MRQIFTILTVVLLFFATAQISFGRALYDFQPNGGSVGKISGSIPFATIGVHKIGRIALTVSNQGHFGTGFVSHPEDPLFGGPAPSCTYPYPSQKSYLFAGSFWIGAIIGRDTLVSVGADGWHDTREMWPDPEPFGRIIYRSLSNAEDIDAVSEQDYIMVYTDTLTDPSYVAQDPFDNRPHRPIGIEVTQRSYAWSYSYADDFILFDYSIKNIGRKQLEKVYMGIYVDGDVAIEGSQEGYNDDVSGFKRDIESPQGCGFRDTINIAYLVDNDGRESYSYPCNGSNFPSNSLTGITGVRVIRTPADSLKYSFNWWISNGSSPQDFGPRLKGTVEEPFRDFGGFLGTPEGDLNKYYIMRHEEFDYDQLFSAVDQTDDGWLPPPASYEANNFADGFDTRYLLSFGPFNIMPGEVLPITFAYVGGENFHTDCNAFTNLFNPADPQPYYDQLNFDEFGMNATWASWIYDNPGVDTDGDGFRGPMRFCFLDSVWGRDTLGGPFDSTWLITKIDTIYSSGDGVPDFVGAAPPVSPEMWIVDQFGDTLRSKVYPRVTEYNQGLMKIRWNGLRTETEPDRFSNFYDFEGYRVYSSLTPSAAGFSVVATYDVENYNRYEWNDWSFEWELLQIPFTLDALKKLYGDNFDPLNYDTRDRLFNWQGVTYYFTSEDQNNSTLSDSTGIHKLFPDEPPPTSLVIDSARLYYPDELTEDGLFFKYYEYEFILERLLPSQLYYVAVTAFDYGSPKSDLESLETPPSRNYVAEYATNNNNLVEEEQLEVIVYPNPYRADGQYLKFGFEGRDYIGGVNTGEIVQQEFRPDDRTKSIHFMNLPHRCTIKIFTIDGDLVRVIDHNFPPGSPRSMHARWDLISRNTQLVVSGIYYYTVESDRGTQIGKIVIIL